MTVPPRAAEVLLESLGADVSFREPVLGDLAEEFALRVERDGKGAARRWYYGESIRIAPHLLRAWLRGMRARDVRRLGSIVLAAYFFTMMLAFLVSVTAQSVGDLFGVSLMSPSHGYGVMRFAFVASAMAASLTGGYIAAWLDERAPLASALALGIVWSGLGLLGEATATGNAAPGWFRVCVAIVLFVGPIIGGMLRVRASRPRGGAEPIGDL